MRTQAIDRTVVAVAGRLRITKRGYALLILVVVLPLIIAAFAFAVNGGGAAAADRAASVSFSHMTIRSGDTLWKLAGEIAPNADPREVVSDIVRLNQLETSDVQPGQRLAIPTEYAR